MTASDQIDGGSGNDTLILNGAYSNLVFAQRTIQNVEKIVLGANHAYSVTMNDGNLSTGQTLTVDASALTSHFALIFDGRQETTAGFAVIAGQGNDTIYGGGGNDSFDLSLGGSDTASGGGGNDTFVLGAALNAADAIDGGTGTDTVILDGDYAAGLVFQAATMVNVERLVLTKAHSYTLTMNDATVAAGQTLTVDGSALGSHDVLTFDGSAETDGFYIVKGGAADDMFLMGSALKAQDTIDGGAGKDTLVLDGDYSGGLAFAASTMTNIETLALATGHSYDLVLSDGNVAAGATLTVDASKLLGGDVLNFDGSAELDGAYIVKGGKGDDHIIGGAGNDKLVGGKGNDVLQGGGGADLLNGGKGDNTYVYTAAGQSTSAGFDTIDGFNTKHDKIDLWFTVAGIDPTVAHGALSLATFDSDLAAAVGAGNLAADHAVLFTPDSGGFAGDTFLIVDANGVAGYQAGQDLVIELDHAAKLDHLKVTDFI